MAREETIFNAAVQILDSAERSAYLAATCEGDSLLRERIEKLVAADGDKFFEQPLVSPAVAMSNALLESASLASGSGNSNVASEAAGDFIGRYKLMEKIGEGGGGVVYVAQQEEPVRRRVALKVIKLGMDTRSVVARFEAERQALALMDHPNIAKVLDAGATETGRPYFVMELVRGIKITDYCDQQSLPTAQRLELFIQVCRAVQHAHQKGIIHRDLKPSNILVTVNDGVPVPKVIDFGIAKATQGELTAKTVYTQFQQFIGTPAYMSPEQAEMTSVDIDTRADIYGLGVLLYELLTGKTPFEAKELLKAGLDELRRTIREREPVRPSTRLSTMAAGDLRTTAQHCRTEPVKLIHFVRGDLDWIVMKCLEKDRARRYETANGLAADLKRHLDNEPVVARPPSAAYRLQKAWRRNKVAFTAAAAVVAALVVGITLSTWQAIDASRARHTEREQRLAAQTERDKAQAAQRQAERAQATVKSVRLEAEHQLYLERINLAQQDWEQNNIGRLRQLLEETRDYPGRGFEWYYLQAQTHLALKTLQGHLEQVASVAFSPDGQRVVTGSWDGTAKVWDADSGKDLLTLKSNSEGIRGVAFSPDGTRIVTGSDDQTATVWDAATGNERFTLTGHTNHVKSVAFSPDGRRIVTGGDDRTAIVWDAVTGRKILTLRGHKEMINSVAFSPDGQRIVTCSWDRTVRVWDAGNGQELLTIEGPNASLWCVAYSPDGRRIVAGSGDHSAWVWDAANGTNRLTLKGHSGGIRSVAFSPNGQRILTGSADKTARVWDASSGSELLTLKGHSASVESVAFSPDGQQIVTGSADQTARIWEPAGAVGPLTLKGHSNDVFSVSFSPNGQRIVTASWDGTVRVWDGTRGKELLSLTNHGIEIPSAVTTLYIAGHSARVYSAAYSPDGQRIVTGSSHGTAKVWEAASGLELLTLTGHIDWILSVAFSPDGQHIATASVDQTAKVWDVTRGTNLFTLNGHVIVTSVAFSPDGRRIVTGNNDGTAKVWDAASGLELVTLKGHNESIWPVAFSPDGQRIVTGNIDNTANVWDSANGTNLLTLRGHNDRVLGVAFSPDGRRIVTGSDDGTAKVWEAASGQELLTLKGHSAGVTSVAFSPDGQRIVTGSRDQTVKVWRAARPEQVTGWNQEDERAKTYEQLKQASASADGRELSQAEQLLTRLLTNANNSADQTVQILTLRANVRVRTRQWQAAAADFEQAIEYNPTDHFFWQWLAPLLVQTGQLDSYREHCRKSLERFGKTTDPYTADCIAKDCLILPDAGVNLDTVAGMSETAVTKGQHSGALPWFQFGKGLAEYRQGRFAAAADWMGIVVTNVTITSYARDVCTEALMVLAMSQYQSRQVEQARSTLAKGTEMEQTLPKLESGDVYEYSIDRLIAHVLMREAKTMIGSQSARPGQNSPARRD
jgi:WD40 repeat protein/serine/threonine protein kinase